MTVMALGVEQAKTWFQLFEALLKIVFGEHVPQRLIWGVGVLALLGFAMYAIYWLVVATAKIVEVWRKTLWPLFYDAEKKKQVALRRLFAEHIHSQVRDINVSEAWSDHKFAELEAEIEIEVFRTGLARVLRRTQSSLRRAKSLSLALRRTKDRLVIVEGDAGAGKSVALRHVALRLAKDAAHSRHLRSIIPVYVNLKALDRPANVPISRDLIESFVLEQMNRSNNGDVDDYLDKNFKPGLQSGAWLFLFDSFDEIPEVLSSVEADDVVQQYSQAVSEFLHGLNRCRGVVASRQFRGPWQLGWPRYRVLPMSWKRQIDLIKRASLSLGEEKHFIASLLNSKDEIRSMASNPMFLGLLAQFVRQEKDFPNNAHVVYEKFITSRLARDEDKLRKKFGLSVTQTRSVAESVAYSMAATGDGGLSPTRGTIRKNLEALGIPIPAEFDTILDALEFVKLARSEKAPHERSFTFSHRRFQEYFATCVVLKDLGRVSPEELLVNGRWRETTAVLLRTQNQKALGALMAEIRGRLLKYSIESERWMNTSPGAVPFPWPPRCLHILSLIQDGYSGRTHHLPSDIKESCTRILKAPMEMGTVLDQKWALEVSGIAGPGFLKGALRESFASPSQWLQDIAFLQVARLAYIPRDIGEQIRLVLLKQSSRLGVGQDRQTIRSHLMRLPDGEKYLRAEVLARAIPTIDIFLATLVILYVGTLPNSLWKLVPFLLFAYVAAYGSWAFRIYALTRSRARRRIPILPHIISLVMRAQILLLVLVPAEMHRTWEPFHDIRVAVDWLHKATASQLFLCFLFAIWALEATVAVHRGRFLHPFLWPFLPVHRFIQNPRVLRSRLRRSARSFKEVELWLAIAFVVAFLGAVTYVISRYPWARIAMTVLAGTVAAVVGYLVFLRPGLRNIQGAYADWRKWKRFIAGTNRATTEDILRNAQSLSTNMFRVRYLRTVRQSSVIRDGKYQLILSAAAELTPARLDLSQLGMIDHFRVRFWGAEGTWEIESLDELYRLAEQVRVSDPSAD